jgi:transposase
MCRRAPVRRRMKDDPIMERYRQMLRQLLAHETSCNQIAAQRGMSHHTVRRAQRIAASIGLTSERLAALTDAELRGLFYAKRGGSKLPEMDWDAQCEFLRKGYNRLEAYARYRDQIGLGEAIAYRTYCAKLRAHEATLNPVLRIEHVSGYAMQTDFTGYMREARDHEGNVRRWKLFVACLPFSRFVHASLVPSERVADHIAANIAALDYFGGVPVAAVPDNLKSAVVSRRGGVVRLQEMYQAFADHYGMAVLPARPRQPRDKAAVEISVKLIQRSLRIAMVGRPVPHIADLKLALAGIVDDWNAKTMRRAAGHSRRSLFEGEEQPGMKPLPDYPFECFEAVRTVRVARGYHVEHAGCYYSVPHRHIGQSAIVKVKATTVQVIIDGLQVAVHPRLREAGAAATNSAHRPPNHASYVSGDLVEWAQRFPPSVRELAAAEMAREMTPQMRTRRTNWVRNLPRVHSRQRFIVACERAVALSDCRFEHVENVLKRGIEQLPPPPKPPTTAFRPDHNVRGSDSFGLGGNVT